MAYIIYYNYHLKHNLTFETGSSGVQGKAVYTLPPSYKFCKWTVHLWYMARDHVVWFIGGLTPQQQPGSYQGSEMMMMKSVIWWRKPEYPEETTDLRQVTDETIGCICNMGISMSFQSRAWNYYWTFSSKQKLSRTPSFVQNPYS